MNSPVIVKYLRKQRNYTQRDTFENINFTRQLHRITQAKILITTIQGQ